MKRKSLVLLFLIIMVGSFLRLYKLDKFPPSLFGDEVDVGYQAYSILKTGKDYMGQPWPISFHSLADWRTPLFLYSDVPFVAIFGLNEWGVRLPAAIFGVLTLPLFFLLTRKLFGKDRLALLSTFLLSVSIWHLQYSRAAFEVTQMLFLLIGGLYFFLKGIEKPNFYLVLSAIFLSLAPYSYSTAKFFLPLFILLLIFCYFEKLRKVSRKTIALTVLIFVLISLPMGYDIFFGKGGNRFTILSVFTDPTVVPQIGFDRQVDMRLKAKGEVTLGMTPSFFSRVFHNKFLYWGLSLVQNYLQVFSTDFLFTKGDINFRHSIQGGFGEFFWMDALFFVIGLAYVAFCERDKNLKKFLLLWLFLSPIPSILTRDGGKHATRLILLLPPFLLLISVGLYRLLEFFRRNKVVLTFIGLTFIVQFSLYLHRYYIHYPLESEEWWHYGFKQLASYAKQNEEKYKYIVWSDSGEPPIIFSLFWLGIDPKIFQENRLIWTQLSDAIWGDRLPRTKYYYGHISKERIKSNGLIGTIKPDILYLMPEGEIGKDFRFEPVPNSVKLLQTIYYPSGRVAKYILTGL